MDFYTAFKPIKGASSVIFYINAVAISPTKYYFNAAHGHFRLNATYYAAGLTAGDAVTASYTPFSGLIPLVQKVIDGDPSDRVTYPGYVAGGILCTVLAPVTSAQTIVANVTAASGYLQATVIANVESAILAYVNGLGIGEPLIRSELIAVIMAVTGVYDVNLTTPSGNVNVSASQIARATTGSVIVS
jgi:hypothetical protein